MGWAWLPGKRNNGDKKKNSGCLLIVIGVGDSLDLCINQLLVEVGGMEYLVGQPPRISGLKGVKSI